ncbi:MAG: hypothetical protein A2622_01035 [Bdellovibrionales bacterium RIFCSPHIGHO2_01_FULL_40_29]|nr:MAG: hypothetical protein A2622_01035 [Bdellovibrionales bacterium RIFCSPHIGHO2_01_FULL_40_29]OFZ32699.1 MAG: hypothetical protein A3D17_05635 [Bdellovibrionales bacterium RIFCSPHIGHO2_02_FULL_40_15]
MAGNNNLELEIHSLFIEGSTPDHICNEILSKYEKNDILSPAEVESISHFLITLGRFDLLFKFYLSAVRRNAIGIFPWGFFAWAAKEIYGNIPDDVVDLIDFGLQEQSTDKTAHKVSELHEILPQLAIREKSVRQQFEIDQLQIKTKLISQLNHNRLYQLHEQEEQTLLQLIRNFPNDMEVRLLHQAHLEKKSDEILSRIRSQRRSSIPQFTRDPQNAETSEFIEKLQVQVKTLAQHYKTTAPEQIYNLAILCMSFELFDLSFELLAEAPETFAGEWLKAELLMESGRYLDLLKHVETIENKMTTTPESTYGAIYLKAQAYYGLGQREIAIQMLESLAHTRPSYRSTEALLHQWRNF